MRIVSFIICAAITVALIIVLNIQIPTGESKTPCLGAFLSPQNGFWQNAEAANTDFNADLKLAGLQGKAEVYFDERLVPHVYADNDHDAYFIQGYLHAKFRLWQMEFQTHAAAGRLSEILGAKSGSSDFLAIDKMFRRLGMVYGAEQSLKAMESNPVSKATADAYTAGVNSYINALPANKYPLEYKLLNYKPEPWNNLKTQLFLKYMSFDLAGGDWDFEMTNAKNIFSAADIEMLYPMVADSLDPIVPKGTAFPQAGVTVSKPSSADSLYYNVLDSIQAPFINRPDRDNGSNNWAVAGTKTKSGAPILCNDPHLGLNLPAIWYEMQISTPNFNAYGVTFPGSPSIIIGFNDSCAWGVTNASRDVKDYFEIEFRDTTMQEYKFNGQWQKSTFRKEVIKVKDGSEVVENIAMTVFGPVMYDRHYANKFKDNKSYAVRWQAHESTDEGSTFYKLNRAKNFNDFIGAISTFGCPGQNFLFASKRGTVAIRQQGRFVAKWRRQGDFVMPGIDSSYMWKAYIPIDENPTSVNPERGFVSSANQRPVDATYPYYMNGDFDLYRGMIINRKLNNMSAITPTDMQRLQTDNYNVFAETARPLLLKNIDDTRLTGEERDYLTKLRTWNLRNDINEEGPTIFAAWIDSLETAVWSDEFSQTQLPLRWPDEGTLVEALLRDSAFKFVDNIQTPAIETLPEICLQSFKLAYKQLKKLEGEQRLKWGKYKDTGVRHLLRLPALSKLHLPIGGGRHIINATKSTHGPGWRMIVHLTDKIEAYGIIPGGQSGNAGSKYYDDFIDTWAQGKYYTLLFLTHDEAKNNQQTKWKMTFSKA
ncbi:MAG: penicillin acylase [Segetibacter sp.]|nr:penicillin acylase [Segetibacter sp.]